MQLWNRLAPGRTRAACASIRIAAMLLASALLTACSVYDMHPTIAPYESRAGGIYYEADLKKCQDWVAARPQQARASGLGIPVAIAAGAGLGGGGAALFHGNVGNAAGLGGLVGAAAGFNGVAQSMIENPVPRDSIWLQICLQKSGYTVVDSDGFHWPAFDPPKPMD